MSTMTFSKAINAGLRQAMLDDPKVVLMGEDIGTLGGVFRITDGLKAEFGAQRVIDTPLAESGIIGTAVGMALRGFRPVCEIQFDGFVYSAVDQIISQVAKLHYRTHGAVKVPMTIRIPFGGGIGSPEHHSESPEAYFAHTAGLRVVSPGDPQQAFNLIQDAIRSDDPVVYFEPKRRYHTKDDVSLEQGPIRGEGWAQARVLRSGADVTLLVYGPLVTTALQVAKAAESEGIDVEVIDVCSLAPLDLPTITESVQRTGHVVVAHEAGKSGGLGAEIVASITERCFYWLERPPVRVTGFDVPYPPSKLESAHLPDLDRILFGIDQALGRDEK